MINTSYPQRGSTLVPVLVMLLLVTIVGTYAINQGLTNLKIATNSQIQKLLMQSSDVALNSLERDFSNNQNVRLDATPVGQILLPGNENYELQFCFKPSEIDSSRTITNASFFDLTEFRVIQRLNNTTATGVSDALSGDKAKGFCNIDTMFAVGRKAVVTQIALANPDIFSSPAKKYQLAVKATDPKATKIDPTIIRVTVTSLAPGLALNATDDQIKTCLGERMMDKTTLNNLSDTSASPSKPAVETVDQCLRNLGVPVNTQVSEYVVNLDNSSSSLP